MKQDTKLEHCPYGYDENGVAVMPNTVTTDLTFFDFVACDSKVNLIATDKYKVIKVLNPENCKIIDCTGSSEKPILG